MVAQANNPSSWVAEAGESLFKFQANLGYIISQFQSLSLNTKKKKKYTHAYTQNPL